MLPYYRKSHTLSMPAAPTRDHLGLTYVNDTYRGTSGPIQASFSSSLHDPIPNAWYQTFRNLDLEVKTDPFSGRGIGGFNNPVTINPLTKERSYSAVDYYKPASRRPNLHLVTGAVVYKILLQRKGPTDAVSATGVRFTSGGETHDVRAQKEVILAAGAFQSPKLLELSGIGSARTLRGSGITAEIDNQGVGENLQDHLQVGISSEVEDGIKTIDTLARQDTGAIEAAMKLYMTDKTGPFADASVNSFAFLPVMKLLGQDGLIRRNGLPERYFAEAEDNLHYGFTRSIIDSSNEGSAAFFTYPGQGNYEKGGGAHPKDLIKAPLPGKYLTIGVCLLHPFSRGNVHITSDDPKRKPMVDPNFLEKALDVEILALHFQYIQTLVQTAPLSTILKPNGRCSAPDLDLENLEAVKEYIRQTAISNWHPVGTCAMLPRDQRGVINERLIVHDTKNLRVVDSSTFPIIPRGNPLSSVYAVAERAADLIKMDANAAS